jgi:cell division protein FtsL
MDSVQRFTQAYSQAPWRKQVQLIGLFLLGLILVALVAGIYLNVTARAATIGRSIQGMRNTIENLERGNADLESQLASLTSNREMQTRASELGLRPLDSEEQVLYLVVPGYVERQSVSTNAASAPALPRVKTLSPDYTQSLFDWLRERVFEPAAPLTEVKP